MLCVHAIASLSILGLRYPSQMLAAIFLEPTEAIAIISREWPIPKEAEEPVVELADSRQALAHP
jgi:hypothetical protein